MQENLIRATSLNKSKYMSDNTNLQNNASQEWVMNSWLSDQSLSVE